MQLTIQDQYRKYTMENILYTTQSLLMNGIKNDTALIWFSLEWKESPTINIGYSLNPELY